MLEGLRDAIMSGQLKPGHFIVESAVAEQAKVSRGPVREALRRLQQEGLVTLVPNKGTYVTTLTDSEVGELHALRALLEGFAMRQVCARSDRGAAVARLRQTTLQLSEAAEAEDMQAFSRLDFELHRQIVEAAGMPHLNQLWSSLNGLLIIWLLSIQEAVHQNLQAIMQEHAALVSAVEDGDAARADVLVHQHIVVRGEQVLRTSQQLRLGSS